MENHDEMDPVITAIWKKFGRGDLEFIEIDDERYFGKKFDEFFYSHNRMDDNVTSDRKVRVITMDFSKLDPVLIHFFMKIWREGVSNHITDVSLSSFLESQQVLDLFGRGVLSFFGVSITGSGSDFDSNSDSNIEMEKLDLADMNIKEGWEFFGQKDKFLVIQNPIPDKKIDRFPHRSKSSIKSDILPFENHHSIDEIGELFYSLAPPEIKKKFLDLTKKLSSELESPSKIWKEETEEKTDLEKEK